MPVEVESCDPRDAQIVLEADAMVRWETHCAIELVAPLRDMQASSGRGLPYPDSPDDEGYRERVALLGLEGGNVLLYSNYGNWHQVLRRCK